MTQELSWDDLNYLLVKVGGTIGIYTWREMSEWERLGMIWTWAAKQEWWPKFVAQNGDYQFDEPSAGLIECGWIDTYIIHPTRFPQLVVDFMQEREDKPEKP
jgi:hypothetical protein